MKKRASPLDHVSVAAPCNVGWDNMVGSERVRFCGQCNLNVFNLSGMAKRDAERLISQTEGQLCIRYYQRSDGTILTKNCPIGLSALKQRLSRVASVSLSAILSFFAGVLAVTGLRARPLNPATTRSAMIRINERFRESGSVTGTFARPQIMGRIIPAPYTREPWVDGRLVRD